jgi:signal transduction histidine kinase
MTKRPRRLGLRSRLIASFTVGAVVLAGLIALLSYTFARGYLIDQREAGALRQANEHATAVDAALQTEGVQLAQILSSLRPADAQSLVHTEDRWFASSSGIGPTDLTPQLRSAVESGTAVKQRTDVRRHRALVVGIPLRDVSASYFEVFPLAELGRTLSTIRDTLALVSLGAAIAAGLLGLWISHRLILPLGRVAATSRVIAEGDLSARLPPTQDPQLAVLTAAFNDMADSLARRIERDARFAGDVSHELRSPLTTLTTSLAVLQGRKAELSQRSADALDLLANEVDRFRQLVEDLLDIARSDAGANSARPPVPFAQLVRRTCAAHADLFDRPVERALIIDPATEDALVLGDKRRLVRVLVNLLENGRRHGGGVTSTRLTASGDALLLTVEDEGPGIPPEDREHIFERFSRGAGSGQRAAAGGTGLGLALVREHVLAHDGQVSAIPGARGGAAVRVSLPRMVR